MQERTIGDKRYGHLDSVQVINKLHKVGPASGLASFYYAPNTIFRHLVKDHLPLLRSKIGSLGKRYLPLLLGIAERTHWTVKITVVSHAENCDNWTTPSQRHICTPLANHLYATYGVNQCTILAVIVAFK